MRVFIAVLLLLFSFQSWTKADDIRDFEIEGISIGDSALNYFSESEIIKNIRQDAYEGSDGNFYDIFLKKDLSEIYDKVSLAFKKNDKKYIIYSMMADNYYKEDFENCLKKKIQILDDIKDVIGSYEKIEDDTYKRKIDKSGKSYDESTTIYYKNGDNIRLICTNWAESMNITDRLTIAINTKEFFDWMVNEAY